MLCNITPAHPQVQSEVQYVFVYRCITDAVEAMLGKELADEHEPVSFMRCRVVLFNCCNMCHAL